MDLYRKIIANPVSTTGQYPLSQEQLDFYWENGYIIIKGLFDVPTLNLFRKRFIEICNDPDAKKYYSLVKDNSLYKENLNPEMYINKIQEILYDPIYQKYSEDPRLMHIVSQFIGYDLTVVNCMLINKPPGSVNHPAHQDLYYFPLRPADKIIATWTAIDTVTKENGCLYIIPGSHKIETMYNHEDKAAVKKQFFHGIVKEDLVAPLEKRVDLEMAPGDTLLFHPYLVHGSRANLSQSYRKSMTQHYCNSNCHYIECYGTPQEVLAYNLEEEMIRRGGKISFADLWRIKSKPVQGIKCHL